MHKIYIVEDNLKHSIALEHKVLELDYIVVGKSINANHALPNIKATAPDIVLIDIHLNEEMGGISLAKKIQNSTTAEIIFVTSMTSNHIIRNAVDLTPAGYLVKPVNPTALKACIELAAVRNNKSIGQNEQASNKTDAGHFAIRVGDKLRKVFFADICFLQVSNKNYVELTHVDKTKYVVRGSLKKMLDHVLPFFFARVHNSYAVNVYRIIYIHESRQRVCLLNGHVLPLGRQFKEQVYKTMNII